MSSVDVMPPPPPQAAPRSPLDVAAPAPARAAMVDAATLTAPAPTWLSWARDFVLARLFAILFLAYICSVAEAGAVAIWVIEHANGNAISYTDALFQSTSAVTQTGLIVVDTAVMSRRSQAAIIVIIILGGNVLLSVVPVAVRRYFLLRFNVEQAASQAAAAAAAAGAGAGGVYRPAVTAQRSDQFFVLQSLKATLPGIIVQGIPLVTRAVITRDAASFKLLVEGNDLLRVMGTPGVRGTSVISNHIMEVEKCLGIEAARVMIQRELAHTYKNYGIVVDGRHLQLLADIMTSRGTVLGITRFGIQKMKESVLMLASFEKTPDHLFDAAVHSRVDPCVGVSESIIIGTTIPVGTGLFGLLQQVVVDEEGEGEGGAAVLS